MKCASFAKSKQRHLSSWKEHFKIENKIFTFFHKPELHFCVPFVDENSIKLFVRKTSLSRVEGLDSFVLLQNEQPFFIRFVGLLSATAVGVHNTHKNLFA